MAPYDDRDVGRMLLARGWSRVFTVAWSVSSWNRLAAEIERGYDATVYEYANDLYCRNWLHDALPLLPAEARETWTPKIEAVDERFRAATIHDDVRAMGYFFRLDRFDPEHMWWWYRRPRMLVGHLREDLREAGVSDDGPE